MTWNEARSQCESMNAQMIEIYNRNDNFALADSLIYPGWEEEVGYEITTYIWLGYQRRGGNL